MNIENLLVLNGASVAWTAPEGWLPDAYWTRHARGEAAALDEPDASQPTGQTARQSQTVVLPDDDANPNTGL